MTLSGGDLGGQEYPEACTIGDSLTIGGYIYRVISEDMAVYEGSAL